MHVCIYVRMYVDTCINIYTHIHVPAPTSAKNQVRRGLQPGPRPPAGSSPWHPRASRRLAAEPGSCPGAATVVESLKHRTSTVDDRNPAWGSSGEGQGLLGFGEPSSKLQSLTEVQGVPQSLEGSKVPTYGTGHVGSLLAMAGDCVRVLGPLGCLCMCV